MSEITKIQELIEVYDLEIKRYEELLYTLGKEFVSKPNKEFLAPDLRQFLGGYPQVKADIDHYIRHRLAQLRTNLHDKKVQYHYLKTIYELEQQLKEKENGKEKD